MRNPDSAAELAKLAHQLGVPSDRVQFLAAVPVADLRELRAQVGEALFEAGRPHFTKVATLTRAVPVAVSARISQLAVPPLLAARISELLDPHRAAELVARLPDGYLADVSADMDPSRAPEVVRAIPPERVATVGTELARRGEWVVMGAFVSYVSEPALAATIAVLDGEQLLRIGFVLDDTGRLSEIIGLLTEEQLRQLLAAACDADLWQELDDLLDLLTTDQAARLAAVFAAAPAAQRACVDAAADRGELSRASRAKLAR